MTHQNSTKTDSDLAWQFIAEELTRQGMSPLQIWRRMNGGEPDYLGCQERN